MWRGMFTKSTTPGLTLTWDSSPPYTTGTYGRIFGKWLPTEQVPSCSPLVKGKYLNLLLQIGGYLCGEILPPGGVPRSTTGLWKNRLWGSKTWFLGIENDVGFFFLFHLRYVLPLIRGVLISSLENLTLYPQGRECPKSVSGFSWLEPAGTLTVCSDFSWKEARCMMT